MASASSASVVGRHEEIETLQRLVDDVTRLPAVAVLDGDAGAGKTTLLEAACRRASAAGYRVMRCSPTQWESDLTFAALGDVVEPVLDEVEPVLADPQRRALALVLSRDETDEAVHPGTVARAFLETLRSLASVSPVLLAVDDAHWLDPETLRTFAFAIRRMVAEPVATLVVRRTELASRTVPLTEALPERTHVVLVGPLSLGALSYLLRDHVGAALPRPTLQRVHDASRGNPFLAIEIARTLVAAGVTPGPEDPLPVPPTVRALLRERLSGLDGDARAALAVAAAMSHPTVAGVVVVAGPGSAAALAEAERGRIITIEEERIRFTHPLLAAQVTEDLTPAASRQLHLRLADVETDAESRARHLAMAAGGPDETVAVALDRAAEVANARGAPAAAAELAERALALTTESGERARRKLESARYHFLAGDTQRASDQLSELLETLPSGSLRAEALAALGRLHLFTDDLDAAITLLREAVREPDAKEGSRAEAEEGLAWSLLLGRGGVRAASGHAERAARLAEGMGNDMLRLEALAVGSMAECLLGRSSGLELAERGVDEPDLAPGLRVIRHPAWAVAVIRAWTDDLEGADVLLEHLRGTAVERGDESSLPRILLALSYVRMQLGDWRSAIELASRGEEAAVQGGQRPQVGVLLYSKAVLDAHLGDNDAVTAAGGRSQGSREPDVTDMIRRLAAGHLALSRSDFERAHHELGPLGDRVVAAGIVEPGAKRFVADEVEALVGLGRLDDADRLLGLFERAANRLGRRTAVVASQRARGLLLAAKGDGTRATSVLGRAVEQQAGAFERARTLLILGTVHRRAQRKADARVALEDAASEFDRLGARAWAARARAEGSRIGGRTPATGLTPTERRVVQLVAQGRTNREIAAATFVTLKAVEATLTRVYTKLGVRSRTELVRRIDTEPIEQDASEL